MLLKRNTISLKLPAKVGLVPVAVATAGEYASLMGFVGEEVQRICLAVEEAACYSISLGCGGERDELLVSFSQTTLGMQLTFRSKGLPLEESALPQFDPYRLHAQGDMTGLSPFLVRNMVDESTFSVLDGGEREITLVKLLPSGVGDADRLEKDIEYCPTLGDICGEPSIRLARPEDAESISRLALRAHGAVFFGEHIYYPAWTREMLASGEMHSIVVESVNGEIIGHCALVAEFPGACVEEMDYIVVDRRAQGQNLSQKICEAVIADATARGVYGLFAWAVTHHVRSQRAVTHFGFREWALLLATDMASRVWQQGPEKKPRGSKESGRIANVVLVKWLGAATCAPLFAPDRHRRMIEHILENAGMRRTFNHAGECPLREADAQIKTSSGCKDGWIWIEVLEYGRDIITRIAELLRLSRAQGVPVIYLVLPLDTPPTAFMSGRFEEMGFFFAGVLPSPAGRFYLALQFLNGCDPGYDAIRINTPFGVQLMEYVRSCDPGNNDECPDIESTQPQ